MREDAHAHSFGGSNTTYIGYEKKMLAEEAAAEAKVAAEAAAEAKAAAEAVAEAAATATNSSCNGNR